MFDCLLIFIRVIHHSKIIKFKHIDVEWHWLVSVEIQKTIIFFIEIKLIKWYKSRHLNKSSYCSKINAELTCMNACLAESYPGMSHSKMSLQYWTRNWNLRGMLLQRPTWTHLAFAPFLISEWMNLFEELEGWWVLTRPSHVEHVEDNFKLHIQTKGIGWVERCTRTWIYLNAKS